MVGRILRRLKERRVLKEPPRSGIFSPQAPMAPLLHCEKTQGVPGNPARRTGGGAHPGHCHYSGGLLDQPPEAYALPY